MIQPITITGSSQVPEYTNEESVKKKLLGAFEKTKKKDPSMKQIDVNENLFPNGILTDSIRTVSAPDGTIQNKPMKDMLKQSWKDKCRLISIFGAGGIGKTVALLSLDYEGIPVVFIPMRQLNGNKVSSVRDCIIAQTELSDSEYKCFLELCKRNWKDCPNCILIFDGINELATRTELLNDLSSEWITDYDGLQIILSARYDASTELSEIPSQYWRFKLDNLTKKIIKEYLNSLKDTYPQVRIHGMKDHIWNVLCTPLMLTIYARIEVVIRNERHEYIKIRRSENAGALIWNYIQSEIFRCVGRGESYDIPLILLSSEYVAPYIAYKMAQTSKFIISKTEFRDYCYAAVDELKQLKAYPVHIGSNSAFTNCLKTNIDPAVVVDYLENRLALLHSDDDNESIQFTHQHFRDCFAAIYITLSTEAARNLKIPLFPEVWKESWDQYVESFLADLLLENYKYPPRKKNLWLFVWELKGELKNNPEFIKKMLRLYRRTNISPDSVNASLGDNISGIDFSDCNLSDVPLLGCCINSLDEHFRNTVVSDRTFISEGHQLDISGIFWCGKDTSAFISVSRDCTVRVWNYNKDLDSYMPRCLATPHTTYIRCAKINPANDNIFASAGDDKNIVLWRRDPSSGDWNYEIFRNQTKDWVSSVAWSRDGKILLCGDRSGNLYQFDLQGNMKILPSVHHSNIRCIGWSTSDSFATASDDGNVFLWFNLTEYIQVSTGETARIVSLDWLSDSESIIFCDFNNITLYRIPERKVETIFNSSNRHISYVSTAEYNKTDYLAVFFPNEVEILRAKLIGNDYVLETIAEQELGWSEDNFVSCASWLSSIVDDKIHMLYGSVQGAVSCIALTENEDCGRRVETKILSRENPRTVRCSSWSKNGLLAAGYDDCRIRIWDVEQKKCIKVLRGHHDSVKCLSWSNDGHFLASGSDDCTLRVWYLGEKGEELEAGKSVEYEGIRTGENSNIHYGPINCILWLPNGLIITGSDDKRLCWYNPSLPTPTHDCFEEIHTDRIYALALSPDTKRLISAGNDRKICLWDVSSFPFRHIQTIDNAQSERIRGLTWVEYSNGNNEIFSAGNDCVITCRKYDMVSDKILVNGTPLDRMHTNFLYSLTSSTDGKYLIAGSTDKSVSFWHAESKRFLNIGNEHTHYVWNVSTNPSGTDGTIAASASSDGNIILWKIKRAPNNDVLFEASDTLIALAGIDIVGCNFNGIIANPEITKIIAMNGGQIPSSQYITSGQTTQQLPDNIESDKKRNNMDEKRFRIALSFPGEYRHIVSRIADGLANVFTKDHILYDEYHRSEFARPNLDTYLQNLYTNESELIAVFICADYNVKEWTGIEWRAIRDLLNRKNADDRIIFIKCGAGEVDGVFGTVDGYIDAIQVPVEDIINVIQDRYSMLHTKEN